MNIDKFKQTLPDQYDQWDTPECAPLDYLFSDSISGVWGMIVPNKMQMIRHACSLLPEDEVYLEAGVLQGMSMICGTQGNRVRAIGVDNWSQFPSTEGNSVACKRALREAGVSDRVELIEEDIKSVLTNHSLPPIGVYHYDANHDYFETLAGLELVLPHLADEAIIIVDDSAWDGPYDAITRFLNRYGSLTSEHGAVELLFDCRGEDYTGVWTTGMIAIGYRKNPRE